MRRDLLVPLGLAILWLAYAAAAPVHPVHALVGFAVIAGLWAAWNRRGSGPPDESTPSGERWFDEER